MTTGILVFLVTAAATLYAWIVFGACSRLTSYSSGLMAERHHYPTGCVCYLGCFGLRQDGSRGAGSTRGYPNLRRS